MSDKTALKAAIDLIHVPSQGRLLRSEPLPDGVLILLRIAAGDAGAEHTGVAVTDRPLAVVQQAAAFFIEQILFAPDADSYRVLGLDKEATAAELRRNVGLLLRWLHPDLDPGGERSIYVRKVTTAWNDLKTPERRAAYDDARKAKQSKRFRGKTARVLRSRHGNRRPVTIPSYRGGLQWQRRLLFWENKAGFFRRALSRFFHTQHV